MLDQALDAAFQGHRRGRTSGAGALHGEVECALPVAAIDDVAAVLGDRRPHPGFDQFLDLVDDLTVGRVLLERRSIGGDGDAGGGSGLKQGRVADEGIEQDAEHFGLERVPMDARRGADRDEIAAEEDAFDQAGSEQGLGQRRRLGRLGIREVAAARLHHRAAGQELAGRRVRRAFGLDQHGRDVALRLRAINP